MWPTSSRPSSAMPHHQELHCEPGRGDLQNEVFNLSEEDLRSRPLADETTVSAAWLDKDAIRTLRTFSMHAVKGPRAG